MKYLNSSLVPSPTLRFTPAWSCVTASGPKETSEVRTHNVRQDILASHTWILSPKQDVSAEVRSVLDPQSDTAPCRIRLTTMTDSPLSSIPCRPTSTKWNELRNSKLSQDWAVAVRLRRRTTQNAPSRDLTSSRAHLAYTDFSNSSLFQVL